MSSRDDVPIFNLRAVVQETSLTPDTLRAWERRYGLPQPERTEGGHRLYSQRDIDILNWLVARQEEGLSISKAVGLWNQLQAEGQNPLRMPEYAAPQPIHEAVAASVGETMTEICETWVTACLKYDERRAEQVLAQAFALYPIETVCFEVLRHGLVLIGEGWYRGEVTAQQEHFASELAMRRLEALVAAAPGPMRAGRILAVCPPDEDHVFGLLLLTLLLRRQGWDVMHLGANVPTDRLETAIVASRPQLAVSVAEQLHTTVTLLEMAQVLQHEGVPLAYGGRIFNQLPELRNRIPAHFLGERLEAAPQTVEWIMTHNPPLSSASIAPETHQQALAHYANRLPDIEAHTWRTLNADGIAHAYLSQANQSMADDISAALTLGDMSYLGNEIEWVEGLLHNHQLPPELLPHYLTAYYKALQAHLDERGDPILSWLAQLL